MKSSTRNSVVALYRAFFFLLSLGAILTSLHLTTKLAQAGGGRFHHRGEIYSRPAFTPPSIMRVASLPCMRARANKSLTDDAISGLFGGGDQSTLPRRLGEDLCESIADCFRAVDLHNRTTVTSTRDDAFRSCQMPGTACVIARREAILAVRNNCEMQNECNREALLFGNACNAMAFPPSAMRALDDLRHYWACRSAMEEIAVNLACGRASDIAAIQTVTLPPALYRNGTPDLPAASCTAFYYPDSGAIRAYDPAYLRGADMGAGTAGRYPAHGGATGGHSVSGFYPGALLGGLFGPGGMFTPMDCAGTYPLPH